MVLNLIRRNADGEIIDSFHDPDGVVFGVTSATPHDGASSLGSLFGARHPLRAGVTGPWLSRTLPGQRRRAGSSFTLLSQRYRGQRR
jgi:hypothetical protein